MRREPLAAHTRTKAPFPVSLLFEVKLFYWVALVIMVVSVAAGAFAANQTRKNNAANSSTATPPPAEATETPVEGEGRQVKSYDAEPQMSIDTAKKYTAVIKTDKGDITVELLGQRGAARGQQLRVPGARRLLRWPHVLPGHPRIRRPGRGPHLHHQSHRHLHRQRRPRLRPDARGQRPDSMTRAWLAMAAPQGGEEVSGSQFYITYAAETHLDGRDTVFGRIVAGQDVLDSLVGRDTVDPAAPARRQDRLHHHRRNVGAVREPPLRGFFALGSGASGSWPSHWMEAALFVPRSGSRPSPRS